MKKAWKAALLSGIVFPGVGQLWLKRYLRGIILILAVCASAAVVVSKSARQAMDILEKLENEGGTVDMGALMNAVNHAAPAPDDSMARVAMIVMVGGWVVGMVDAYLVGRKEDLEKSAKGKRQDRVAPR